MKKVILFLIFLVLISSAFVSASDEIYKGNCNKQINSFNQLGSTELSYLIEFDFVKDAETGYWVGTSNYRWMDTQEHYYCKPPFWSLSSCSCFNEEFDKLVEKTVTCTKEGNCLECEKIKKSCCSDSDTCNYEENGYVFDGEFYEKCENTIGQTGYGVYLPELNDFQRVNNYCDGAEETCDGQTITCSNNYYDEWQNQYDSSKTDTWSESCSISTGVSCEKENTPPKIQGSPKAIYIKELGNTISLLESNSKGKIKINSVVYDRPEISDKETGISNLKLQIGSSKITSLASSVNFNSADIGINFKELPKLDKFYLKVSDDGKTGTGEANGEEKSDEMQTQVYWCPEKLNLKGAYDVRISAKRDIWKYIFRVYIEDELMFERMYKELSSNLDFSKGGEYPSGTFSVHMINEIRHGLSMEGSRPTIEAGRSRGLKDIQRKLEGKLGFKISEEIAKWGCAEGFWKEHNFDETGNNSDKEEACEMYESEKFDYKFTYDFDSQKLILIGIIGNTKKTAESNFPREKFNDFLEIIEADIVDAVNLELTPNTKVKIAETEYNLGKNWLGITGGRNVTSGYLENDWHNKDVNGMLKPSEVAEKVRNCLEMKKPETAKVNTEENTITTKGLKSYYYIQEPFSQSIEGYAIKISFDKDFSEPIEKIFYYDESKFNDEKAIALYRYDDGEIDAKCTAWNVWCNGADITQDSKIDSNDYDIIDKWYLFHKDETNPCSIENNWCNGSDINRDRKIDSNDYDIIDSAVIFYKGNCNISVIYEDNIPIDNFGGTFSIGSVDVIIPENAVSQEGVLSIQEVSISDCFKEKTVSLEPEKEGVKSVIEEVRRWYHGEVGVKLVIEAIRIWRGN